MAKMFYTLEEAAGKLKMSADKVKEMASSGQLQEFRDRDKLVFKREQVDLLAGGDDDSIKLADSGEIALVSDQSKSPADSGSGAPVEGAKERSGISIFDADEVEDVDPMAQTQVAPSQFGEAGGSGSGLLDLTKEADDTSLGGNLLDDVYANKDGSGSGAPAAAGAEGALFEPAGVASDVSGGVGGGGLALVAAEPYDATWSGISGGLAFGMVVVCGLMVAVAMMAMNGAAGSGLVPLLASNLWMYVGILAAVPALGAAVGFFVSRK